MALPTNAPFELKVEPATSCPAPTPHTRQHATRSTRHETRSTRHTTRDTNQHRHPSASSHRGGHAALVKGAAAHVVRTPGGARTASDRGQQPAASSPRAHTRTLGCERAQHAPQQLPHLATAAPAPRELQLRAVGIAISQSVNPTSTSTQSARQFQRCEMRGVCTPAFPSREEKRGEEKRGEKKRGEREERRDERRGGMGWSHSQGRAPSTQHQQPAISAYRMVRVLLGEALRDV